MIIKSKKNSNFSRNNEYKCISSEMTHCWLLLLLLRGIVNWKLACRALHVFLTHSMTQCGMKQFSSLCNNLFDLHSDLGPRSKLKWKIRKIFCSIPHFPCDHVWAAADAIFKSNLKSRRFKYRKGPKRWGKRKQTDQPKRRKEETNFWRKHRELH